MGIVVCAHLAAAFLLLSLSLSLFLERALSLSRWLGCATRLQKIYAKGGACFTGTMAFFGQVSTIVTSSATGALTPVITQLPTSNHDHAINGLAFDNAGVLLAAIGGNTNAGVPGALLVTARIVHSLSLSGWSSL